MRDVEGGRRRVSVLRLVHCVSVCGMVCGSVVACALCLVTCVECLNLIFVDCTKCVEERYRRKKNQSQRETADPVDRAKFLVKTSTTKPMFSNTPHTHQAGQSLPASPAQPHTPSPFPPRSFRARPLSPFPLALPPSVPTLSPIATCSGRFIHSTKRRTIVPNHSHTRSASSPSSTMLPSPSLS